MRLAPLPLFIIAALAACNKKAAPADAPAAVGAVAEGPVSSGKTLATIGNSTSHIEGIAAHDGKLYVADWKDGVVYRVDPAHPTPERVAQLPTKPGQMIFGIVSDKDGNLYFAIPDSGYIYRIAADRIGAKDFDAKKDVSLFATGVLGANGVQFDKAGHLWITGGNVGALYHVGPNGGKAAVFAKDYAKASTDTTIPVRPFVVNGIGFDSKGYAYTVNTGTGEVTRLKIGEGYKADSIEVIAKSDKMVGADGVIVDDQDNLWITCNYRNAIARVAPDGTISEIWTNRVDDTTRVLRFPAELKRIGKTLYIANLNLPYGGNVGERSGASIAALELR